MKYSSLGNGLLASNADHMGRWGWVDTLSHILSYRNFSQFEKNYFEICEGTILRFVKELF